MPAEFKKPLKVFLCHASDDKPQVLALYERLISMGVDAWLDSEKILPGQDWKIEIPQAVKEAEVVLVCLSNRSLTKEGYYQKEIKFALEIAEEKPERTIFLIPARLENCSVPEGLQRWQWVDLYKDTGFTKLMQALKERADKVGAAITPILSKEEDEEEFDKRITKLYTEGLAAFYMEDWDKACQRFLVILSEQPNYKVAKDKLEEAERQRHFSEKYNLASRAYQEEDWNTVISLLEEVFGKSSDYKNVSQLLHDAKKQKQLRKLYDEARALHKAKKWQAVINVFNQISNINKTYQDIDGLLLSAEKELEEQKRLTELNELYSEAVYELDSGHLYEARSLLERVSEARPDFLETRRLLRKVEDGIAFLEAQRKRVALIQTLYEQARKMLRARQWGSAKTQMEEIHKLDSQFVDSEGVLEKAISELRLEEQKALTQKRLAAVYVDAVNLLNARKYQAALEKWNEIQEIDPMYKDHANVTSRAKKEIAKLSKLQRPWVSITFIVGGLILGFLVFRPLAFSQGSMQPITSSSTITDIPVLEVSTNTPTDVVYTPTIRLTSTLSPTSTPLPSGTVLFKEDFEDGVLQNVSFTDSYSSDWKISPDENGNEICEIDNRNKKDSYPGLSFGSSTWSDYIIEYRIRFPESIYPEDQVWVSFRYKLNLDYVFTINGKYSETYLAYGGDSWKRITTKNYKMVADTWYIVRVIAIGSQIDVFIDDQLIINTTDSKLQNGSVGLFVDPGTLAQFDDIRVTTP